MKPRAYNINELRCNSFAKEGLVLDVLRYEQFMAETNGFAFPHRHNYYMILLATEGSGSQLIDFKSYDIKPGMIFLMQPGIIHAWKESKGLKGYLIFFTPDFFSRRYNDHNLYDFTAFSMPGSPPYVQMEKDELTSITFLFEQLLQEYNRKQDKMMSAARSLVNLILIQCDRIHKGKSHDGTNEDIQARLLVKQFEQLVHQHYKDKKLVKDYAELLHLSPNYLNIIVKQVSGQSAGEVIRQRVMLEAKRMLAHDQRTVAEIGYALNFKDNSYFCRFFKKYEGESPDKFRKNVLKI